MWRSAEGALIEHVRSADESYCIYHLTGPRGTVVYAATRKCWSVPWFRWNRGWRTLSLVNWQFFTTLREARFSMGNVNNEKRGVAEFPVDRSRYTETQEKNFCLCCGYRTIKGNSFSSKPPGTWAICPVCSWEDDLFQYRDPDDPGSANHASLKQAQRNFVEFGANRREDLLRVRPPAPDEDRDPNWRFIE